MLLRWVTQCSTEEGKATAEKRDLLQMSKKKLSIMDQSIACVRGWLGRGTNASAAASSFLESWKLIRGFAAAQPSLQFHVKHLWAVYFEVKARPCIHVSFLRLARR